MNIIENIFLIFHNQDIKTEIANFLKIIIAHVYVYVGEINKWEFLILHKMNIEIKLHSL